MKIYLNTREVKIVLHVRNKTQAEAARQAEISPEQFSRLMNHDCQPSPATRKRLAKKAFPGIAWDRLFKIDESTGTAI